MNGSTNTDQVLPDAPESAVDAVDILLHQAVSQRASDIHLDPRRDDILVRFRVDGEICSMGAWPKRLHEELIARLKILSGARTDIHALPQDGRWRHESSGADRNIRISFMPTYHGENAVIRILPGRMEEDASLSSLGFTPDHVRSIRESLGRPHGLILVTGPTGSGKTTTLNACLTEKSKEPLSIITLEDPIEYEIPGIRQVHIRHSHGVTFASGLRASLRQDPDVIMIGEIRDAETAAVAIHTALTGHLVLSTLHTNSALESIPRLFEMGVDQYLLASTLKLVVAQRLVRNICEACGGEGCFACSSRGYSGRSLIAEVLEIDSGLKELVCKKSAMPVLQEHALSKGFKPIEHDGLEKIEWGITSREEVLRVLHSDP